MKTNLKVLTITLVCAGLLSCAGGNKSNTGKHGNAVPEGAKIIGIIPANSPFAKLQLGMSIGHVHDLIGQPTDQKNYSTGKAFIPFYFGSDMMRMEELYKGQGRIIYTGLGVGGANFKVFQIVYDPSENGYSD